MPEHVSKNKENKIMITDDKILDFPYKLKQSGQGIKILTPSQMLSRLPISLVQLNAGNNSKKIKNEITQLLYSLNR